MLDELDEGQPPFPAISTTGGDGEDESKPNLASPFLTRRSKFGAIKDKFIDDFPFTPIRGGVRQTARRGRVRETAESTSHNPGGLRGPVSNADHKPRLTFAENLENKKTKRDDDVAVTIPRRSPTPTKTPHTPTRFPIDGSLAQRSPSQITHFSFPSSPPAALNLPSVIHSPAPSAPVGLRLSVPRSSSDARTRKPTPYPYPADEEDSKKDTDIKIDVAPSTESNADDKCASDDDEESMSQASYTSPGSDIDSEVDSELSCICFNCRWRRGELSDDIDPSDGMEDDDSDGDLQLSGRWDNLDEDDGDGVVDLITSATRVVAEADDLSNARPPLADLPRREPSILDDAQMAVDDNSDVEPEEAQVRDETPTVEDDDANAVAKAASSPVNSPIRQVAEAIAVGTFRIVNMSLVTQNDRISAAGSRATSSTLGSDTSTLDRSAPPDDSTAGTGGLAHLHADGESASEPSVAIAAAAIDSNNGNANTLAMAFRPKFNPQPVRPNSATNEDVIKLLTALNESVTAQAATQNAFITATSTQLSDLVDVAKRLAQRQESQDEAQELLRLKVGRIGTTLERIIAMTDKLSNASDTSMAGSNRLLAGLESFPLAANRLLATHEEMVRRPDLGPQLDGMDQAILGLEQKVIGLGMFLTGKFVRGPDSVTQNGLQAQFDVLNNRLNNHDETLRDVDLTADATLDEVKSTRDRIALLEEGLGIGGAPPPLGSVRGQLNAIKERLERNFKY